jgi:aliphatic sulfonates family ABC transporter substrate-binding protein
MDLKKITLVILGIFCLLIIFRFYFWQTKNLKVIKIGYQPYVVGHSNIILALKNKHLLEQRGYKPKFIPFLSGPSLNEAIMAKKLDIGFAGDFPTVSLLASGAKVKIIATTNKSLRQAIVVDNDKINAIKNIKDLKGKKIALVKGSASHYFLLKVLKDHGIDIESVKIIHTDVTNQPLALISNEVDAIVSWEPWPTKIEKEKIGKIIFSGDYSGYIFAQEDLIKKEPQKVQDFIEGLQKALEFAQSDILKTCLWVSEETKEEFEVICDGAKTDRIFNRGESLLITKDMIKKLEEIADFAIGEKLIYQIPDLKNRIDSSFVGNIFKK